MKYKKPLLEKIIKDILDNYNDFKDKKMEDIDKSLLGSIKKLIVSSRREKLDSNIKKTVSNIYNKFHDNPIFQIKKKERKERIDYINRIF